jgi:dihydrofolate synthase/folylpolyglutamate synthase
MGKPTPATSATTKPKAVQVVVKSKRKGASFADFDGACRWLLERTDVERISPSRLAADTLKLGRMQRIVELLGHPDRAFKSVHVAGTKGKGSTCEMTAAGLEACGYTVGLYTSPHLMSIRERIRLNRANIAEAQFVATARRVAVVEAALDEADGEPTFFELITAMAFCFFEEQAVDVAVIEVGLGGRLDSTNIITPEVAAITRISLDHTQLLGSTLDKIAREKAGIFKSGIPALSAVQPPGIVEVLREEAARVGAPLRVLGEEIEFSARFDAGGTSGTPQMRVSIGAGSVGEDAKQEGGKAAGGSGGAGGGASKEAGIGYEHITVPLRGEHQAANCALALAILSTLGERGFRAPEEKVTRGLASVSLPGRLEILRTSPRIVLDGAHNAESVMCVMKTLSAQMTYDSMVVVFGCAADKDIDGMLRELSAGADKVVFTRTQTARAADPRDLARRFTELTGKMAQTAPAPRDALELAKRAVAREDLICVTGSFYLVAEIRELLGLK